MDDTSGRRGPDLSGLRLGEGARAAEGRGKGLFIAVASAALLVAVVVLLLLGRRAAAVEVSKVRPAFTGGAAAVLNASGYVTPRRRATVAAKITGRIQEMLVEEGIEVSEGQVLARLDDREARAQFGAAEAERKVAVSSIAVLEVELKEADRTMERVRKIGNDGIVSDQEIDRARTAAESLRARLQAANDQLRSAEARSLMARRDLENCTVRAPFSGIAVSKDAQVGEIVSPISAGGGFTRTDISTIVDMASLEIEVDVNEASIARIEQGQRVEAVLDAYPDWRIPASVRTVIPTADRQKATVKVRIAFDALDPRILPDMGVKVAFLAEAGAEGKPLARAIIPKTAAREEEGKQVVFVLKDGRLERRAVTLGAPRGEDMEVMAGVSEGEEVVVAGPQNLKDGQRAKTIQSD